MIVALGTVASVLFLSFVEPDVDLNQVLEDCKSKDDSIRIAAIAKLGDYPDSLSETAPMACRYSAGVNDKERNAAEIAIQNMGAEMLPHVVAMLSSDQSLDVNGACNAFGLIGGETQVGDEGLFALVQSEDYRKNFLGLKALQSMGNTALPIIDRVQELLHHKEFNVQLRACNVMAALGPNAEPALDDLLELAEKGNLSVRSSAMIAIGSIGTVSDDPRILESLSSKLDQFKAMEKERALLGLAMMGERAKSVLPKVESLMNDRTKSLMPEAAYAFVQMGGELGEAEAVLLSLKDDFTYQNRVLVQIEKLGQNATAPMIDLAIEKLESTEPSVREAAVFALAKMGSRAQKALPELRKVAAKDEDILVRQSASDAIKALKQNE
jgi:HEAT repeat protein